MTTCARQGVTEPIQVSREAWVIPHGVPTATSRSRISAACATM